MHIAFAVGKNLESEDVNAWREFYRVDGRIETPLGRRGVRASGNRRGSDERAVGVVPQRHFDRSRKLSILVHIKLA